MNIQYPLLELGLDHLGVKAILDLWFVFGAERTLPSQTPTFAPEIFLAPSPRFRRQNLLKPAISVGELSVSRSNGRR